MTDLVLLLFINALAIIGIYISFGPEMIFDNVGRFVEKHIHYGVTKPMFNCPTCMASIHSIYPFWLIHEVNKESIFLYIIYIPALAGLSTWMANTIVKE